MEQQFPEVLFTQSEEETMTYATSAYDDRFVIIMDKHGCIKKKISLTTEQVYALSKELPYILKLIGRGRRDRRGGHSGRRKGKQDEV